MWQEVNINFTPQELEEYEARQILNSVDIYYLRMLMWILLDTTQYTRRTIEGI